MRDVWGNLGICILTSAYRVFMCFGAWALLVDNMRRLEAGQ